MVRPTRLQCLTAVATVSFLALAGCGSTVPSQAIGAAPEAGTGVTPAPGTADGLGIETAAAPLGATHSGGPAAAAPVSETGIGGDHDGSPRSGSPAAPGSTGAAPDSTDGGSRIQSPITVGVLAAGDPQEGAESIGGDSGNSVSAEDTLKALIRHFEARGGIAGRELRAIYDVIPNATTDYRTALQASCARFTQDNNVELVVSAIGYYADNFTSCLHAAGVAQVEGAHGLTDDASFQRFPNYYTPGFPSYDLRFATDVAAGVKSGALRRGMRVGVVVEECPFIQRAYAAQFLPRAQQAGLIIDEARVQCTTGFQDAGAIAQQIQAAAFRFRANNDETVMFASYPVGVHMTFFTQFATSQGYYPKYFLDSLAVAPIAQEAGQYPADQLRNMRGVGWSAPMDVTRPTFDRPEQKRCLAIMRQQGVHVTRPADYFQVLTACDAFFVVEAALDASGGRSDLASFQQAVEALGADFSAGLAVGETVFSPGRHYGTSRFALFGFVAGCKCFRHSSRPRSWAVTARGDR